MVWQACRQTNLQLNKENERQAGAVKCMTFVCYHMFALVLELEGYQVSYLTMNEQEQMNMPSETSERNSAKNIEKEAILTPVFNWELV